MGRKSASGIRNEHPGSYFLELRNHFLGFFGVEILKFFDADPGWRQFGSGMEKVLSGIRDKPPGSATPFILILIFPTQVEPPQEEEDLFARAMSGLGEDDGNAADEDSGTARDGGGRTAKKRPRESAGCEEYDAEGRVKERRVGGSGESGGARGGSKSSSINGGARPELENKFRIPSPPRCGTVPKQGSWSG